MNTTKMRAVRGLLAMGMAAFFLNLAQAGIPIQHWTQPGGARHSNHPKARASRHSCECWQHSGAQAGESP